MDSIARRSRREEFLDRYFQHLGKIEKCFVIDVRETCFDLGNTAAADIETGKLELDPAVSPPSGASDRSSV